MKKIKRIEKNLELILELMVDLIKEAKLEAIKRQDYMDAANLREKEVKLIERISELKSK
jgi:hypothetical protein